MPKRSRKPNPKKSVIDYTPAHAQRDENQSAFDALQQLIARTEDAGGKNPLAVALGRLGGLKGGHARAAKMSPAERSKSAKKAAKARWGKKTSD